MKITPADDLRQRLDLGKLQSYVDATEAAAEEAFSAIQSDIRSPLYQASYSDLFLLDTYQFDAYRLKFKLSAGFVDSGSVVVGTGITQADAEADTSLTDLSVINLVKGSVWITQAAVSKFISIRYDAGFPALTGDYADVIDLTTAPQWLQDAAPVKSIALIGKHPVFTNKEGKSLDTKSYEKQYSGLIMPHVRYMPDHLKPINE